MEKDERIVISASRRTDLVSCYPDALLERLRAFEPKTIHTIVLWTKNPRNLLTQSPLRSRLLQYRQLYLHLTITGMGGGAFEPAIPPWKEVIGMVEPLIELTGSPQRISWRFDPIIEVQRGAEAYTNWEKFPLIAEALRPWGIRDCRVSWVSPYPKVIRRLGKHGWSLRVLDPEERKAKAEELIRMAQKLSFHLHFCAQEDLPLSRCIDGSKLQELHPDRSACSERKDRKQRPLCGCSESVDIGSYALRCRNGCLYCYALP